MNAAAQHFHGATAVFPVLAPQLMQPPAQIRALPAPVSPSPACRAAPEPREFFIQGITLAGKTFRPSDWSERLAGALSSFRPQSGAGGIAAHIGYSPYCVPRMIDGIKCVIVSEALRDIEPMAWDFVMHFARDNELQVG